MKLKPTHKISFGLLAALAAVVLCTLPFWAVEKETIYLYTSSNVLTSREKGFIRELKNLNYGVKVNPKQLPVQGSIGFWFKSPAYVKQIGESAAKYNFIYNEEFYPFEWQGLKNPPIVLTPYRKLYEHYMRANVKSALFTLGVNPVDFYQHNRRKVNPLVYYGDNKQDDKVGEQLLAEPNVRFLGRFWPNDGRMLEVSEASASKRCETLAETEIVIIPTYTSSPQGEMITAAVMEATACGALVMSPENQVLKQQYGESIVYYRTAEEAVPLVSYYLNNKTIIAQKTADAAAITQKNATSAQSAKRFKQLYDWLKNNS